MKTEIGIKSSNTAEVARSLNRLLADENVLYIKSSNGSLKNKVTVKISVNQLKEILIDGETALTSFGYLASPKLFVLVEGDSYVALKNAGAIYVKNGASTTFEVKKSVGRVVIGK